MKCDFCVLIIIVVVQFVNAYASFFYIAFVAEHMDNGYSNDGKQGYCGYNTSCMATLAINLAIVFGE
jgi:hypothetical protein